MIAGVFSNLATQRQDAEFATRLSTAARAVVHDVLNAGATRETADSIEELAHLFSATQQAAAQQSQAVLGAVVRDLNRSRAGLADGEHVIKDQSMHVCPPGFRPMIQVEKNVGQLVLHHSPEEAFFSDGSLPHSGPLTNLEQSLETAADAARHGDSKTAGRLLGDADHALSHLVSRPTEPVPIMAGRTLREDERYQELKLAVDGRFHPRTVLSEPVPTVFVPAQGGRAVFSVPLVPRQLALLENLPPHLDIAS